jgi:hypothetical protein
MRSAWRAVRRFLTAGVVVMLAVPLVPAAARASSASNGSLRVFAGSDRVVLKRYPHEPLWFDVGVYVAAQGGSFDLRVSRDGYRNPIQISQVLHRPDGSTRTRPLPADVLDGWFGLARFLHVTVVDDHGTVVRQWTGDFCPDGYGQRVNDHGPTDQTFPQYCSANPFTLGMVWGIDDGWAVDPAQSGMAPAFRLDDGRYQVTVEITRRYRRLFSIPASDASATVTAVVKTVKHGGGGGGGGGEGASPRRGSLTPASTVTDPDPRALPDMVPLPAWGIGINSRKGHDYLDFGATVWVGGSAPLVVEGFRHPGTDVMTAYQYFYRDGDLLGRTRVGRFTFDRDAGHQHWHFKQFARYSLLDGGKSQLVRSEKTGFCIAPTDAIDLTLAHAVWHPEELGFSICGDQSSIWVREEMPVGWGDTYFQYLPGQSFDITHLPNGTYYIEVQANPLGSLHETNAGNDASLRRVILGGTPGDRTVRVPPWHGIDSEGGGGCPPICA